ncbi:hypothetical protein B0H17DRAFT_117005 [Mycena rosella]|uniref:Uncharacterized protein n=1 Tax=Mycena rosella TaxID=1033263 RepID=A0AAD7GC77_MYCRO|nr:hypothetical protein B0H17DRAFT_117005 [Mycena rosella]
MPTTGRGLALWRHARKIRIPRLDRSWFGSWRETRMPPAPASKLKYFCLFSPSFCRRTWWRRCGGICSFLPLHNAFPILFFSSSVLRDLEITGLPRITLDDATEHVVYIYCSEQSGSVIDRGGGAGDGGLGGAEGSGGGGGDPSGRNGNDKGGGGGGGRGHDFTTRVRFAQCSVLPVRTQYTSPDGSIRKKIIAHSARRFEEAWTVPFRPFDISNPTMAGELQLLYHATRRSQLDCFLPAGIQLQFHTRQHELAVRGAFYACNNLATAVAHALTYKHSPASRVDPVVVFVFAVDPEVIQGSKPSFDGASLKLRVLDVPASQTDVGYREQYRQFCTVSLRHNTV